MIKFHERLNNNQKRLVDFLLFFNSLINAFDDDSKWTTYKLFRRGKSKTYNFLLTHPKKLN